MGQKIFPVIIFLLFMMPTPSNAQVIHHARVGSIAKKSGLASCNAHVVTDDKGNPVVSQTPLGFTPAQLRSAYSIMGKSGSQPLVAIVDAYDDPTIQKDLTAYSLAFHLPLLPACVSDIGKS